LIIFTYHTIMPSLVETLAASVALSNYMSMSPEEKQRIQNLGVMTDVADSVGDTRVSRQIAKEALSALGVTVTPLCRQQGQAPPSEGATSAANTAVPPTNNDNNSTQKASTTGTGATGTENKPMFGPERPPSMQG
jgi:hypothetical protein